jgi:hypothetical protein
VKRWFTSTAVLVVFLWGGTAVAQQNDPIETSFLTLTTLEQRWTTFRDSAPGTQEETEAFERFTVAQAELGIPRLRDHALALLRQADNALNAGNEARSNQLFVWASQLAPDAPERYFFEAAQGWDGAPWSVPGTLATLGPGYRLSRTLPAVAPVIRIQVLQVIAWIILSFASVFYLLQIRRYFQPVVYDISIALGHLPSAMLTRIAVVGLLILPSLLFATPILLLPTIAVFVAAHQNWSERSVSALVMISLIALPGLYGAMGHYLSASDSIVSFYYDAQQDRCDSSCLAQLERLVERNPGDEHGAFALASVLVRTGTDEDLGRAAELLSAHAFADGLSDWAGLLRGKILFIRGQTSAAERAYSAVAERPDLPPDLALAVNFNLYRTADEMNDRPTAERHLSAARAIDRFVVAAFLENSVRRTNRWVMSLQPPPELLFGEALRRAEDEADAAGLELWKPIAGRLAMGSVALFVVLAVILMGGATFLQYRVKMSKACPKCNRVMSVRETPQAAQLGYCHDCYRLFMQGASLSTERRKEIERRVDSARTLRRYTTIAGNVLLGGVGYLLRGRAWIGAPLLLVVLVGLAVVTNSMPTVGSPFAWGIPTVDGRFALAELLLFIGYGTAWGLTIIKRKTF